MLDLSAPRRVEEEASHRAVDLLYTQSVESHERNQKMQFDYTLSTIQKSFQTSKDPHAPWTPSKVSPALFSHTVLL